MQSDYAKRRKQERPTDAIDPNDEDYKLCMHNPFFLWNYHDERRSE